MACANCLHPLLRSAAPTLSRRFFEPIKHQSPLRPTRCTRNVSSQTGFKSRKQTSFLTAFRSKSTASRAAAANVAAGSTTPTIASSPSKPSALSGIQHAVKVILNPKKHIGEKKNAAEKGGYFPKFSERVVAHWLFGSAASVFGIVVFGGLTRLTESGLSITEWKPITGSLPPFTAAAWASEFHAYQRTPEFRKLNPHMTLTEFKQIYWMEWTHRLWGRVIGLSFALPALYFISRRRVSAHIARNLLGIKLLIITQGAVGWWMVASGLKDELFEKDKTPRVSQYRLATHLSLAFATYLGMLWTGMTILRERRLALDSPPTESLAFLDRLKSPKLRPFRVATAAISALVALTAFSGALVAGLDAGLIYNEFPHMGLSLVPPTPELLAPFYSRRADRADLVWRNALENPVLVQFDHRVLATATFSAVNALGVYAFAAPGVRSLLPVGARHAVGACVGLVWMQAALGISTLVYMVPVPVAAAHQAGALALLTGVVVLGRRVWTGRRVWGLVRWAVKRERRGVKGKGVESGKATTGALKRGKQS